MKLLKSICENDEYTAQSQSYLKKALMWFNKKKLRFMCDKIIALANMKCMREKKEL